MLRAAPAPRRRSVVTHVAVGRSTAFADVAAPRLAAFLARDEGDEQADERAGPATMRRMAKPAVQATVSGTGPFRHWDSTVPGTPRIAGNPRQSVPPGRPPSTSEVPANWRILSRRPSGSHLGALRSKAYAYRGLGHEQVARGLNPQESARNHGYRVDRPPRDIAANHRREQHLQVPLKIVVSPVRLRD